MAFVVFMTALTLCCVFSTGFAAAVTSGPVGPDAQSGSALDGNVAQASSISSSSSPSTSASTNTPAELLSTTSVPTIIAPTASSVPFVSDGSGQVSGTSLSPPTSISATSGTSLSSVPYNLKSMENPYFVSFLEDFARQSQQNLQDVQATAVNDPQIGLLWDVYVQTFAGGATLPSLGGGDTNSRIFESGTFTTYQGTSQQEGTAATPTMNTDWFQFFGKDPTQTRQNSNTQYNPTQSQSTALYTGGVNNNLNSMFSTSSVSQQSSGNSSYSSQYGSNTTSAASSMQQMFPSFFPTPSYSQQQQQQQYSRYPQQGTMGTGMNRISMAQNFLSMMSPFFMQSWPSQTSNQRYSSQTGSTSQSGRGPTLPDTGWNIGSTSQKQPTQQSPQPAAQFSNASLERLSTELMMLLGKLPVPTSTTNTSSVSSTTSPSSSAQQVQPTEIVTQTQSPSQTAQVSTSPKPPRTPVFNSQIVNIPTNQVQGASASSSSGVSLMNFEGQISGMGLPGQPQLQQQSLNGLATNLNMLRPFVRLYNARYEARASRDLGCRTLGEMLDMDVPRAMDLTCRLSCSAIMPGTVTGKRFGLTCLCCPVYVSDRAIGMRSMYRRAEALT